MEIKEEVEKTNQIEKVTRLIALFTLIIIAFGYGSLSLYYYKWGITISSYIDASEIILAFTSYFYEVLLALIVFCLYSGTIVFLDNYEKKSKAKRNKLKKTKQEQTNSDVKQNKKIDGLLGSFVIKLALTIFSLFFAALYIVYVRHYLYNIQGTSLEVFRNQQYSAIVLRYASGFLLYPMVGLFLFFKAYFDQHKINRLIYSSFIIFGSLYFYLMIDLKYDLTKNDIFTKKVELLLDNGTIVETSKDSLIFIGSTRSYLFFSDRKAKDLRVRIIPFDRVKEHTISE